MQDLVSRVGVYCVFRVTNKYIVGVPIFNWYACPKGRPEGGENPVLSIRYCLKKENHIHMYYQTTSDFRLYFVYCTLEKLKCIILPST